VDLFIAMSEFSRAKHAEFGFPREMHVLPPFVDDPVLTENDASPHHRPYFFFAGRLEKIKGLHTVVPLMAAVPEADLVVAGDGSYRETLARMSAGRVRFLGSVSQSGLARYYRHAVATLVPSISYETFGQTLIESFAASTPVIARRLGPFPEIINACKGGLLFSGDDELVAAMRALVSESGLRNQLAENALRGHRERWSEAVVVPRYLELASLAAARVR